MFVIRVVGTDHLWPVVMDQPPALFDTKEQAQRKLRHEFTAEQRHLYEVVEVEADKNVFVRMHVQDVTDGRAWRPTSF